jgi:opacity protein-like surface antigen
MTMGRAVLLAASLMLVSGESTALEGVQDGYARKGFFVGIAGRIGVGTFEDDVEDEINDSLAALGYVADVDLKTSWGLSGFVGYRFHSNFSAELQAEWQDGIDSDISLSEPELGKIAKIEIEPWVITGNVKGHLLTGRFQPYLLVGAGVMTAKVKMKDSLGLGFSESDRFTGFAARFGGGIDFYTTESIVLTLGTDYVLPTGDVKDLDYVSISVGFQYRF